MQVHVACSSLVIFIYWACERQGGVYHAVRLSQTCNGNGLLFHMTQPTSRSTCGGRQMAPHINKWSSLDAAHKLQVTVIVTTSELSQFIYPYIMIVQPSSRRMNSSRELYSCWLLSCQFMPRIAIFCLCFPQQLKAIQSTATHHKSHRMQ